MFYLFINLKKFNIKKKKTKIQLEEHVVPPTPE